MNKVDAFDPHDGVAIIGMTGRFPGAYSVEELWQNLKNGVESIAFFSDEELLSSGIDPAVLRDPHYVKAGAVLKGVELFDAAFFGVTPSEAEITDPQHRLFLECAWEALECAGYDSQRYKGSIGVYAGTRLSTYLDVGRFSREAMGRLQAAIGNEKDYLTSRVSYKLNLTGPSVCVQTTCSTSLVAVHLACQGLLNGECDMALAGGVAIRVPQKAGYFFQEGFTAPDGHCRAFDAKAQGTVFGNGVGIVVLKRLADALADGDCIHAVIKGSAINNDGGLKVGYTAPSVDGQASVIAEALAVSGVDADTITYIETHGTGTPLGDPIEITALTQAFRASTQKSGFCAIGSVKTNIGHLDTAAGVAGLIKTVLALKYKMIPASLHFEQPNPRIDFAHSPFYVNATPVEWRTDGTPRRAGVSSFGIGGTNAHVVLEEAPMIGAPGKSKPWQLIVLSAQTSSALETATSKLAEYLTQHPDVIPTDVSYTLQVGRRAFNHRRMLVSQGRDDALSALAICDTKRIFTSTAEPGDRPVAFMFPGQGAQYVRMALELYQGEPVFREQIDLCAAHLRPYLKLDLPDVLYPGQEQTKEASQLLSQTWITQPALFAVEYALAKLWMAWGIHPQAMIGHSIGEYVAACLAGVFSVEDALALVAARGQLMQGLPIGAMLAVLLPEAEVVALLGPELSLAAVNGPSLCVVSGPMPAVDAFATRLSAHEVQVHRLHTSHAFHSTMMDPILELFTAQVSKMVRKAPAIPFISNLTGTWITAGQAADPGYWAQHLRQTVRFSQGLQQLAGENLMLLEVGPGHTLTYIARQHKLLESRAMPSIRHAQEKQSDDAMLLHALGHLWMQGAGVAWEAVHRGGKRRRVSLPTYPFERQRYWVDSVRDVPNTAPEQGILQKRGDLADWFYAPVWRQSVAPSALEGVTPGPVLIFADDFGLGNALAAHLEQRGQEVAAVTAGIWFARTGDQSYIINPAQPDDYRRLITDLQEAGRTPGIVVHLWGLTNASSRLERLDLLVEAERLGFNSLLFLAQALYDQGVSQTLRLMAVTNEMQGVIGDEVLHPERAVVLGPCRVIDQEYAHFSCSSVDIVLPEPGTPAWEKVLEQLSGEIRHGTSDRVVAYRGRHRWVQSYEPVQIEGMGSPSPRLRSGGVYLITGGLGRIGLELAEYLAIHVKARLVLVGRSAVPSWEEWKAWTPGSPDADRIGRRVGKLKALESQGAEFLICEADVADQDQMRAVIRRALDRFGAIHGVFHAAGVLGNGVMQLKTPEMAAEVLRPKVRGTLVLDAVLKDLPLDFILLFSSIAAVIDGVGQVDYCAANAFLDAFAHYSQAQCNRLVIAADWGAWQWDGWHAAMPKGMSDLHTRLREFHMQNGMTFAQGLEALNRVLTAGRPQLVVSPLELQVFLKEQAAIIGAEFQQTRPAADIPFSGKGGAAGVAEVYSNAVEARIAGIWTELLRIPDINPDESFFDLKGHSLLALRMIARVRQIYQVDSLLRQFFEAPTIVGTAAMVLEAQQTVDSQDRIDKLLKTLEDLPTNELELLLSEVKGR